MIRRREGDSRLGLRFEGREWTWDEVVHEMARRATVFAEIAPKPPAHIGILLDNVPEFLFALGAAALSGRVIVGLNSTRPGQEIARDLRHTDCTAVLTDRSHRGLVEGLDLGAADGRLVDVDDEAWPARVTSGEQWDVAAARTAPEDLFLLLFTAGSTGAPKAVRCTQGRAAATSKLAFAPDDVLYCPMPLFHGNALFSTVLPGTNSGALLVLRRRFSASALLDDVRSNGVTFFSTVGRALSYVVATPETPHDRDHRLKFVLAPESAAADAAEFERRFGVPVISGYGSSENAIIFVPQPGLPAGALGVPYPGLDLAVADPETGRECPSAEFDEAGGLRNAGEAIGEIVGRNVLDRFEGYYNNPEATAQRARNGWYWSGDLGYRDAEGIFYFAGRTSDWLRVDGENFAAAPVERVLVRYPSVSGVAVFGVPDETTVDDQVMAVLEVADPSSFDPADFDSFLAAQPDLGRKWAPRYVRLVTALPVTATNKVDKTSLRGDPWPSDAVICWRQERRGPLQRMTSSDVVGRTCQRHDAL